MRNGLCVPLTKWRHKTQSLESGRNKLLCDYCMCSATRLVLANHQKYAGVKHLALSPPNFESATIELLQYNWHMVLILISCVIPSLLIGASCKRSAHLGFAQLRPFVSAVISVLIWYNLPGAVSQYGLTFGALDISSGLAVDRKLYAFLRPGNRV